MITLLLIGCVILSPYLLLQRSSIFIFTKTTNLSGESLVGIQLYQSINSEEFIKKYGMNLKNIDNALYAYYDLGHGLQIATNKKKQVIRIAHSNGDTLYKTNKGISLGSSIDEVINAYGPNYYKRTDDQMPESPVIGYVDHKRKVTIEFFNVNNKVVKIMYDITSIQ